MTVQEDSQGLNVGEVVQLFKLDLTKIGGDFYYFTPTQRSDGLPIVFQGQTYVPVDIYAEGFEVNSTGPFPQPVVRIANISRALTGIVRSLDDLIGAKLTRIRTLKKYLDGEPGADPTAHYPPDVYFVEQRTAETKLLMEFKLVSVIDIEGQRLPRRRILRNYCNHVYRRYDAGNGTFAYNTCPYDGPAMFDQQGNPVTSPASDKCGKRHVDCQKRFGSFNYLPSRAFPGAGKFGGM